MGKLAAREERAKRLSDIFFPTAFVEEVETKAVEAFKSLIAELRKMVLDEKSPRRLYTELLSDQTMDLFIVWVVRQAIARWMRQKKGDRLDHAEHTLEQYVQITLDTQDFEGYLQAEVLSMGKEAETLVQMAGAYVFDVG